MVSKKDRKKILDAYFDLRFPRSYGSPTSFHEAVRRKLGLNVSLATVKKILKDTVFYQVHYPRRKNLFTRHLYLRGVGIEGIAGKSQVAEGIGQPK